MIRGSESLLNVDFRAGVLRLLDEIAVIQQPAPRIVALRPLPRHNWRRWIGVDEVSFRPLRQVSLGNPVGRTKEGYGREDQDDERSDEP